MISDRIMPGTDFLNAPTLGILYRDQNKPDTARRLRITTAGDLWLIPPGGTDVNEAIFGTVAAGEVIDQQHDGVGSSTNCTVDTVQF